MTVRADILEALTQARRFVSVAELCERYQHPPNTIRTTARNMMYSGDIVRRSWPPESFSLPTRYSSMPFFGVATRAPLVARI